MLRASNRLRRAGGLPTRILSGGNDGGWLSLLTQETKGCEMPTRSFNSIQYPETFSDVCTFETQVFSTGIDTRPYYSETNRPLDDPSFLGDLPPHYERLQDLLDEPEEEVDVDLSTYLSALKATSECKEGGIARRAEMWMFRLLYDVNEKREQCAQGQTPEQFTIDFSKLLECYLFTIQAWANSHGEDAAISSIRAEKWLKEAKKCAAEAASPKQVRPLLTQCYNAYLDVCSRGRHSKIDNNIMKSNARRAEDTFRGMVENYKRLGENSLVQPNTNSVNFVMRAITRCKKDPGIALRAKLHLQSMETSADSDSRNNPNTLVIRPNAKSYNIYLDALRAVARHRALRQFKQEKDNSKRNDDYIGGGLEEIKAIQDTIGHMKDLSQKGCLEPMDNIPYNTLLSAWAGVSGLIKTPEAAIQAENVFRTMEDMQGVEPDAISYLSVIRAWVHSGSTRAAEKATWWLDKQWSDFDKPGSDKILMPKTQTYELVIKAWGNAGHPDKAERLLFHLLERYEAMKAIQLQPTTELFASSVQTWLQAAEAAEEGVPGQVDAWKRAVQWLDYIVQQDNGSGPTSRHDLFLNVLKVARSCADNRQDVLEDASRAFDKLQNSRHHVDQKAYACLLEVGLRALPGPEHDEARSKFVTELVAKCRHDGLVSKPFVRVLTNGPLYRKGWTKHESDRLVCALFPDWPLPPSWTRNLKRDEQLPSAKDLQRTIFEVGNSTNEFTTGISNCDKLIGHD